ncbi:hypothetical protein N7481_006936 [Penicillium waksmanii]|uniref:uncharacterized protein n=1 Tax=Penicillium waksmanii TaxID=69791 RepID=UPI0025489CD5|nr:uncharacterized protein N7481_006936 [Penicillium waksmanii]KAJ5979638.1 hypothetical protein N7481_006936 [Penicillium waksmanii]
MEIQIEQVSASDTVMTAPSGPSPSMSAPSDKAVLTPSSLPPTEELQHLRSRVKQLEEQLTKTVRVSAGPATPSPNYNISTTRSHFAGTFHVASESATAGQPPTISRSIMHKTRVFGQSHWMNGVAQFAEVLDLIEPLLQKEGARAMSNLTRCKWLGKTIKAQRTPAWPCPPTRDLPRKDVADALVGNYLRTSESVYRVLHVPTFQRDYEDAMNSKNAEMPFLILLKLAMAIGSSIYDDRFSMRATAIRWVHEAQTWISEPESKARLSLQFLQIHILLLLAREIVGVDGALVWVSTGELFRLAVYMGLNRDPEFLPIMPCYSSEMRRRLWNTILELVLQSSMEAAGPPLCSLDDFNTLPPGNFDDEAITQENPIPAPDDVFTDVSVALALRKMVPLRLCIIKILNGISSHAGYEDTLRLDQELRVASKLISRELQGYKTKGSGGRVPSDYQTRIVDFFIRRYMTAIHMPFFSVSLNETQYAFSRKVVIETSLKTWCTIFPMSSAMASHSQNNALPLETDELSRLALCGTGTFRTSSMQAVFLIAAELKTQVQEETSTLGPMSLRRDLYSVLQEAKKWSLHCIEAGETNIKGYLFLCLVCAQIKGLMNGLSREELPTVLLEAAEEAEAGCLSILEGKIDSATIDVERQDDMAMDPVSEIMADWSLMMPDTHFYLGDSGNMDWMTMDSLAACASYSIDGI